LKRDGVLETPGHRGPPQRLSRVLEEMRERPSAGEWTVLKGTQESTPCCIAARCVLVRSDSAGYLTFLPDMSRNGRTGVPPKPGYEKVGRCCKTGTRPVARESLVRSNNVFHLTQNAAGNLNIFLSGKGCCVFDPPCPS
jgi:hypothetical protein